MSWNMTEQPDSNHRVKPEDGAFMFFTLALALAGIVLNTLFIRRTQEIQKKKDRITDIRLLTVFLAIFNILYLLDAGQKSLSLFVAASYSAPAAKHLCDIFIIYIIFVNFGIFYLVTAIVKECLVLSINTVENNQSNRFQMIVEVLIVGAIYVIIQICAFVTFAFRRFRFNCYFDTFLSMMEELFSIFIILFTLIFSSIFTCITAWKAKTLSENNPGATHIILQSRKICALYFGCFLPFFVITFHSIISSGSVHLSDSTSWRITQLFSIFTKYASSALFPLVWKVSHERTVEHEMLEV